LFIVYIQMKRIRAGNTLTTLVHSIKDDDGSALDLTGKTVTAYFEDLDGQNQTTKDPQIADASTGLVHFNFDTDHFDTWSLPQVIKFWYYIVRTSDGHDVDSEKKNYRIVEKNY